MVDVLIWTSFLASALSVIFVLRLPADGESIRNYTFVILSLFDLLFASLVVCHAFSFASKLAAAVLVIYTAPLTADAVPPSSKPVTASASASSAPSPDEGSAASASASASSAPSHDEGSAAGVKDGGRSDDEISAATTETLSSACA